MEPDVFGDGDRLNGALQQRCPTSKSTSPAAPSQWRISFTPPTPANTAASALTLDKPLLLYDLDLSATWYVEGNDAYKQTLRDNLDKAAQYLYDFTDGQMTLEATASTQSLDNWDNADVRLYASNTLRPNGGGRRGQHLHGRFGAR
ncbi:MAG: hypothetical protein R2838_00205 [Caldilineaceae bacterium]